MNDDWRLKVDLHEQGIAHKLAERLDVAELQHDLESAFSDRVIVSVEGSELFCYAGTREQAERAQRLIRAHADERGWSLATELNRWHPAAEEWQDPDLSLPEDDADLAAERGRVIEKEREESRRLGYPAYEVRVQCVTQQAALRLAKQLQDEGLPSVRRWNFVLLGAVDEDGASRLAERVRTLAPADTAISAQASLRAVADGQPANPFAVFGGLAG